MRAIDVQIDELSVKVIHLDDSIRIKSTIGGPRYLDHLPLLRELQRERRARGLDY